MDNKIKIYKSGEIVEKVELNGVEIKNITKVEIRNEYTPNEMKENIVITISGKLFLEIVGN